MDKATPTPPPAYEAVTIQALDAAFAQEIRAVSSLEYNSNEMCRAFYANLRARLVEGCLAAQSAPLVTQFNVGRYCLSEYDCIAQGINFAAYERGVSDAAEAFSRNAVRGAQSAPTLRQVGWMRLDNVHDVATHPSAADDAMRAPCFISAQPVQAVAQSAPLQQADCTCDAKDMPFGRCCRAAAQVEPTRWTCFHCSASFTDSKEAALHFGTSEIERPACTVDVIHLRDLEHQLARYREEDTDLYREIYRLGGEHTTALMREEEKGYERGLRDGQGLAASSAPKVGRVIPADGEVRS